MSNGLNAEYFTSQEVFDIESERIFRTHWLNALRSTSLQHGEFAVRQLENASLILIRGRNDGVLRAFYNVCRHRGATICETPGGSTKQGCVTCPYHAWTYNERGELVAAPNLHAEPNWRRAELGLSQVACEEWNGYAMVHLAEPDAFEKGFRPILTKFDPWDLSMLRTAATLEYDVNANWKILFHNYSECYHCPTVHPALNRLTPSKSAKNDLLAGAFLGGPMQLLDGVATMSLDGEPVATTFPRLSLEQKRQVSYYTIFPSMFISTHPDYVMVHRLERVAVDRTQVTCEFLIHPDANPGDGDGILSAVEFWDTTNRQDWHVCERVQAGAASPGFQPAIYSSLETVLPEFDRYYRQQMQSPQ